MPRTTLDARRLGLSVDARPPLRTSRKTRYTASGRSAGTEPPTTPGCFPHRARPDPRGFLLVRFSNVGRHRAGGRRHAAAHIEKPPTSGTSDRKPRMTGFGAHRPPGRGVRLDRGMDRNRHDRPIPAIHGSCRRRSAASRDRPFMHLTAFERGRRSRTGRRHHISARLLTTMQLTKDQSNVTGVCLLRLTFNANTSGRA